MNKLFRCVCVLVVFVAGYSFAIAEEPKGGHEEHNCLRLFNTCVFGKRATEPIVLLNPASPGRLDPSVVLVDIDKGKYFAATVSYPKKITFAEARASLNSVYAKYEEKSFSNNPTMGLWRNEDEQFSIQLTENEDHFKVIYITFSPLGRVRAKE